jgi:hypothetical protein
MGQQGNGGGGYDNTNRFTLFKNKKKQEGDNKPDLTGKVDVNGKEFWLSAWRKKAARAASSSTAGRSSPSSRTAGGGQRSSSRRSGRRASRPCRRISSSRTTTFPSNRRGMQKI